MKLEELRIGNYLEIDEDTGYFGQQCEIKSINGYDNEISVDCNTFGLRLRTDFGLNDLKPIPLTEEWLLRFGFEKCRFRNTVYENKSIILDSRKCGYLLCDNSIENLQYIQYVHQLQNLYFALTGEELKLIK